jgi:hypothetical protein
MEGRMKVTRRQGRKWKKLLDDFKKRRGYLKLKEEVSDCTVWRIHFGRGCGRVIKQIT